jgi:carboxypeptidase family protein
MQILGLLCASVFWAFLAQTREPPSPATVEGSVINRLTGAPVKSAHVIYTRTDTASAPSFPLSTDTDAQGHFRLQLAPGSYRLWVERNGFARQVYGALSPAGEGTGLALGPGQELQRLMFRMVPLGAVAGHVFDEDGEPLQNVGIQVLRFSYAGGHRQLLSVAGASSNDRGEYRVFGLPAAWYLLLASPPGAPMSRAYEGGALVPEVQDAYSALYYPGVLDVDSASVIALPEGGDLADVDFRLRRVRTATVRGRLISPFGRFSAGQIQVVLAHNEGDSASYSGRASAAIDSATGRFEVHGVAPGSYLLVASQLNGAHVAGGRVAVELSAGSPPQELIAALTPAFEITGVVEVEGAPRGAIPGLIVRLAPAEGLALGPRPWSKAGSDGSIRLAGVTPGPWTLIIDSLPEGLWLKTASFGDNEIVAGELNVKEGAAGQLRITLAGNGAQILGTVTVQGQPCRATVVLAPAASELRMAHQMYRVTNTGERGTFSLKSLRPGSYKLFAFQEIEPFTWFDPELLKTVEALGNPVSVSEGEVVLRDLVAIPPEAELPQH